MEITNLYLKNFRNYNDIKIDFAKKLNLIYGSNGSGKTNLVEAIYILSLTKSFRVSDEKNLLKFGSSYAEIKGTVVYNDDKIKYAVELDNDNKKVFIDGDRIKKISDYITRINTVLYNPFDNHIISDSPSYRRRFLNIEISQINRSYLLLLNAYNKILKHRNAYLKQLYINGNASHDYLDILTNKLIDYGVKINNIRNEYLNQINAFISDVYETIFSYGKLVIKYKSTFNNKSNTQLLDIFKKNYQKEISFGKTLYGVHHDDFEFILDGKSILDFGSVGQQKNAILSFKIAETKIIKEKTSEEPILILDDLFSELDKDKINKIIGILDDNIQTFITTTDIDKVDNNLLTKCLVINIDNGIIKYEN